MGMETHYGMPLNRTRCGKTDYRPAKGMARQLDKKARPPLDKTKDWTEVTCKACLKAYVYPNGSRGRTERIDPRYLRV